MALRAQSPYSAVCGRPRDDIGYRKLALAVLLRALADVIGADSDQRTVTREGDDLESHLAVLDGRLARVNQALGAARFLWDASPLRDHWAHLAGVEMEGRLSRRLVTFGGVTFDRVARRQALEAERREILDARVRLLAAQRAEHRRKYGAA